MTLLGQTEPDLRAARDARASGAQGALIEIALAADALGDRDYPRAAEHYAEAHRLDAGSKEFGPYWILSLSLAGRNE